MRHQVVKTLAILSFLAAAAAVAQGVRMNAVAKGEFAVKLQPLTFEGADPDAGLGRMSIDKTISGDLTATTKGQMLSAMSPVKGSAGYVALERVTGTLAGRTGSFVFQHNAFMNRGVPSLSIVVVPDSGTAGLAGIQGDFKIEITGGKHWYEFVYSLPQP